ncbi:MAG: prephenate dehydrogenase [Planctomycetota bacterium]|jgi:prephenate dehydrogenase
MQPPSFQRVTIVGAGLLGGSVGLALRARGFKGQIAGVGRRQETLDTALAAGCIDSATLDLAEGVLGADLVVLATPVGSILTYLETIASHLAPDAIITDVGSTKRTIVETAQRLLPQPGRFVGSHPMAGGALHGPSAAHADLFDGKPVVLTPTDQTDPEALQAIEQLWASFGMIVRRIDPTEHDLTVARISHLPHAVAVLLVMLAREGESLSVASTGFAGITRVAAGDPEIWADIFLDNAEGLLGSLDEFDAFIGRFRQTIEQGDRAGLIETLAEAQKTRKDWQSSFNPKTTPE